MPVVRRARERERMAERPHSKARSEIGNGLHQRNPVGSSSLN
jgi:hypothetical protein